MKIALVTGAGTGIGRAVSLSLAEGGWSLILTGRRTEFLKRVAGEVAAHGGEAHWVGTDVRDESQVLNLFAEIRQTYGRLDLLFNNAGLSMTPAVLDEVSLGDWKNMVDVNLTGAFLCAREAFRLMRSQDPQGGRIINNGSVSARVPRPRSAAYSATKHALTGLTRSTALDGRAYKIACGQIDIGNADAGLGTHFSHEVLQADGSTRLEPTIDVAHVARAVRYMADLPLEANVLSMSVMASFMPFVGRG